MINTVVLVERLETEGAALAPEILAQSPLAIRWLKAARFAFKVVAENTLAQGAELIIRSAPVVCHCQPCGQSFHPQSWIYRCPHCGALSSEVISGKELELTSLEIE